MSEACLSSGPMSRVVPSVAFSGISRHQPWEWELNGQFCRRYLRERHGKEEPEAALLGKCPWVTGMVGAPCCVPPLRSEVGAATQDATSGRFTATVTGQSGKCRPRPRYDRPRRLS